MLIGAIRLLECTFNEFKKGEKELSNYIMSVLSRSELLSTLGELAIRKAKDTKTEGE